MTLSGTFAVAAGGVTGRDHRRAERDGQDGHAVVATDAVVAAVVTDGCSSGKKSEIGARIGAAWIATLIERTFRGGGGGEALARAGAAEVARELLVRLELLARSMDASGDVRSANIGDCLLFGFLAAVVTDDVAMVFGIGDGIVVAGDVVIPIDPGPDNAPPYAAYGLLREPIDPVVHFVGRARDVDVLAVATDGLSSLDAASLVTVCADPRYAHNASLLRKRLIVLSDAGKFSDDATIGVVRRRGAAR